MRGVFVTGTDTGVGKTIVTAGITYCLRSAGIDAVPMKPVQTGAVWKNGRLVSPDLRFCLETCRISVPAEEEARMSPYCFKTACSPHLAAAMDGSTTEIDGIVRSSQRLLQLHKALIVEGAGGVFAPINESETMLDVMRALSLPVVVVARTGLGTINHTLLTLQALRNAGVEVFGVFFNSIQLVQPAYLVKDNIRTILRLGNVPMVGQLESLDEARLQDDLRQKFPNISLTRRL